ncbi:MAG TPA: RNA polymerase factor sigma-54 [Symbiobacteriaceae bacterium]|nr:RNA polymerase factor sigma-54 [Symbiobacteriaceae bacterium]
MRLGFGLQMQQTQKLVMTPELRQAIAVLQLPVAELGDFIEQEMLENPCLESEPKEEPDETAAPEARKLLDYLGNDYSGGRNTQESDEDEPTFEAFTATMPTLQEHLMAQLYLAGLSPGERRIGEFLIDSLDDHGYLTISVADAADKLAVTAEQVEPVLQVIHGFDPPGVGARSLQECLLLQWATVDDGNPLVPALIEHHLDDLGEGRVTRIAEALGATPAEVQEAVDLVRTLDPKPGRRFGHANETRYVVPDVVVERVGRDYVVLVNETPVPKLTVSNHYRQMLNGPVDADARKFVEQKIHSALWLIKAIEQRRMTLYKVTEAIVRFQRDFFDRGVRYLRPLTLHDVADVVGVHESTVSRATSGKYVQTPAGTFELKFFFSSGVDNARGEGVAAESVKRMIADLIAKEDASEPLSDQALTDLLGKQGVNISRRTVAKYREEMGVPSSGKRKRYK